MLLCQNECPQIYSILTRWDYSELVNTRNARYRTFMMLLMAFFGQVRIFSSHSTRFCLILFVITGQWTGNIFISNCSLRTHLVWKEADLGKIELQLLRFSLSSSASYFLTILFRVSPTGYNQDEMFWRWYARMPVSSKWTMTLISNVA
jgi:hypothetical protein